MSDTIFAPATAPGRAAIAIVRISGPQTKEIVETIAGSCPKPRFATLRDLRAPDGTLIDRGLLIFFAGPNSFTGEDSAEFHVHGGRAVLAALLKTLSEIEGCRIAEAGEFSRRAVINGVMDLTEAEGLADLIDAETEAQRRIASRQMAGELGRVSDQWREKLIDCLARSEAVLDFSDEADVIEERAFRSVATDLKLLRDEMERAFQTAERGERLRDGLLVLIAGPPNAGKSSLLNHLARRDVAIVSPIAGTTRDLIEVHLDLEGYPVTLIDTAGIRETSDPVELEGMRRTKKRAERADLLLWLQPSDSTIESVAEQFGGGGAKVLTVLTKTDLASPALSSSDDLYPISVVSNRGIDALVARLKREAEAALWVQNDDVVLTRARHKTIVAESLSALDHALASFESDLPELIIEDIRLAARAIGRMTGHVGVEEILDRLFSSFCIGK